MAKSPQRLDDQIYGQSGTAPSDPRDSLKQREHVSDIPAEQLERIPTMSQDEAKQLEEKRQPGQPADSREDLSQIEQSAGQTAETGTSFYKKPQPQKSWLGAKGINTRNPYRRYLIFGGIGAGIIALIIALLSFLSVFKLDGLMSNIEQRAFLRHNASLNTRSSKYISAYIEARMMDWGDSPNLNNNENTLFRSNRVDTNSPFTDWYRTLRTSNFEQEVFEKQGIKFTSAVGPDGKARLGKIDINGETPIDVNIPKSDLDLIQAGDIKTLNKYQDYFNLETFNNNKEARKAIKDVVNANTHWYQAYQRRFLRKAIQNMTGVTDWKFFETTRDKTQDKKVDIRNRILDRMLPNDNVMARVVRCLYGISQCKPSRDPGDPENKISTADLKETPRQSDNNTQQSDTESKLALDLDQAGISDALKKVLVAANIFNKILNIPSTLDMLSYINQNLPNLVKLVVIARGAQAAGLFQVLETSRDQIKTGQVSSGEVNAFMENIDTFASSAAWTQVIAGDGAAPGTAQTGGVCSQDAQALKEKNIQAFYAKYKNDNPTFDPLCADQQIGNAANAQKIQTAYNTTIGPIVGPIVGAWSGLKSTPIIGSVINVIEKFSNWLSGLITGIVGAVLNALGLQDNVRAAIAWVFAKTSNFLGLTILKGYETPGTIANWALQGGSYTAESATRQEGGALTNTASLGAAQNAITQYQTDQRQETSLYNKVASLGDPNSLAFRGATELETIKADPSTAIMSSLHNVFGSIAANFGNIFGGKVFADTPNGYSASQFADIETYDYPQKCYDLDPITEKPLDGTNALDVFANPLKYGVNSAPIPVSQAQKNLLNTWGSETDSDTFYQTIYDIIGNKVDNPDDIAVHIYNCNLLDTVTRGSLGYLYGYNQGYGL